MEETLKKHNINFNNTDKLIVFTIMLLAVAVFFISEFEIKIICAVLCLLGIATLFLSRTSRKKEFDYDFKPKDTSLVKNESIYGTGKKFDKGNPYLDKDFIIISSVPKNKKNDKDKQQGELSKESDDKLTNNDLNKKVVFEKKPMEQKHSSFQVFSDKKDVIAGKDPKIEFNFFLYNILEVIKESVFGHTVLLYWVDSDNKVIVLEAWVTSSEQFNQNKKETFEYTSNLVGKVIESNQAEVITNINPDSTVDLLGYYAGKENVNSVLGIPIFYDGNLIAVLVVDSLVEDSFGDETVEQLNKFVVILTNLIKSSSEKFEYYIDSQILKKLDSLQSLLLNADLNTFVLEVSCFLKELVEWDYAALITYDGKNFIINGVTKKESVLPYVLEHQAIDIYNSMVGLAIQENRFLVISDASDLQQPRFFLHENIHNSGSLLVMPIHSLSNTYGAMLFESNKKNYYSSSDVALLNKVCRLLSSSIEIVSLNNLINEKVTVDDTGILKPEALLNQISIELSRQTDVGVYGILLMFSIDKRDEYISKYGDLNFNSILLSVINIIMSSIPVYDVVGKVEDNIIAVYRSGLNIDDGKVYAEKIRKLVAGNIVTNFDAKSFSVTVSIGLIETYKFKNNDTIIDSCKRVLQIAIDEGGNRVKIN